VAFAFTVMADPVSSVAYAIEAALDHLDGDLASLWPTMALVVATIAVVAATYHQLIDRYPGGGESAEGLASAFGEGWAFLPVGALLVDFTLTIAVSCAASASALIAYAPGLADARTAIAVALAVIVAAGTSLGHRGRVMFATATLAFVTVAFAVIGRGAGADSAPGADPLVASAGLGAVLLAMPLGMALATGVEAPANAVAQLPQLDDRARRRFGQLTLWIMVAIVALLTLSLAALAVLLDVGRPPADSTLIAEVARRVTGGDATFAVFQAVSALLLLAAAASSYLAGSGLLEALAAHGGDEGALLPRAFTRRNRFLIPQWGLAALLGVAAAMIALAGGREQEIVQFYAVAVFASFLGATIASARLSHSDGKRVAFALNVLGAVLVAFVLALNLTRLDGVIALCGAGLVSGYLWSAWVRRGRPSGVASIVR